MPGVKMALETVNQLEEEAFVARFGGVYEDSPWIARAAWRARPFANVEDLIAAFARVVDGASVEQVLGLIRAHPDLVGRAARTGQLGRASAEEQASAGLNSLSNAEIAAFNQFNNAYWAKFDFPFVICAREHTKASILEGFAERLPHDRATEMATARCEIDKIARLRLLDLLERSGED